MSDTLATLPAFLLVGATATAIQFAILYSGVQLGLDPTVASSLGYLISAGINYALNYRFTFRSTAAHSRSAARFAVVAGAGLAVNWALMYLFVHIAAFHYFWSQIATTALVTVSNFLLSKYWTYVDDRPR